MENKNQLAFPDTMRGAPQSFSNQTPESLPTGLTKLEWFAGMALQGMLTNNSYDVSGYSSIHFGLAKEAIMIADELLSQLQTTTP